MVRALSLMSTVGSCDNTSDSSLPSFLTAFMFISKPLCDICTGLLRATTFISFRLVVSSSSLTSTTDRPATDTFLSEQPR